MTKIKYKEKMSNLYRNILEDQRTKITVSKAGLFILIVLLVARMSANPTETIANVLWALLAIVIIAFSTALVIHIRQSKKEDVYYRGKGLDIY